jgi:hypothetical protein
MAHPSYSPDLLPYDFFLFSAMKQAFARQHFAIIETPTTGSPRQVSPNSQMESCLGIFLRVWVFPWETAGAFNLELFDATVIKTVI